MIMSSIFPTPGPLRPSSVSVPFRDGSLRRYSCSCGYITLPFWEALTDSTSTARSYRRYFAPSLGNIVADILYPTPDASLDDAPVFSGIAAFTLEKCHGRMLLSFCFCCCCFMFCYSCSCFVFLFPFFVYLFIVFCFLFVSFGCHCSLKETGHSYLSLTYIYFFCVLFFLFFSYVCRCF